MLLKMRLLRAKARVWGVLVRRLAKNLQVRARLTRDVRVRWRKTVVMISIGTSCKQEGPWLSFAGIEDGSGENWRQLRGNTMAATNPADIVSMACYLEANSRLTKLPRCFVQVSEYFTFGSAVACY